MTPPTSLSMSARSTHNVAALTFSFNHGHELCSQVHEVRHMLARPFNAYMLPLMLRYKNTTSHSSALRTSRRVLDSQVGHRYLPRIAITCSSYCIR